MYVISKLFEFEASHQLDHMPEGHQCKRMHGHSFRVELVLRRDLLDDRGFVMDYGEMKPFKDYIDTHLDHRHLNDVLGNVHPTAENLARHLYEIAWNLFHTTDLIVRVSETQKTWASYSQNTDGWNEV